MTNWKTKTFRMNMSSYLDCVRCISADRQTDRRTELKVVPSGDRRRGRDEQTNPSG